jgi:hypothetical protein
MRTSDALGVRKIKIRYDSVSVAEWRTINVHVVRAMLVELRGGCGRLMPRMGRRWGGGGSDTNSQQSFQRDRTNSSTAAENISTIGRDIYRAA